MIGLLKNNFYGTIGSAILFFVVFSAMGLVLLITGNPTVLNIMVVISATAFAFNAVSGFRKEASTKWNKYELTAPVRRKDIVKSRYISHVSWAMIGVILAGIFVCLAVLLHGNRYFYHVMRDPLSIFSLSIGVALLLGAFYYPSIYFFGADKSEIIIIISLLGSIGITFFLIWLLNVVTDSSSLTDWQYICFIAIFMGIISVILVFSYFLTVHIFRKKEY